MGICQGAKMLVTKKVEVKRVDATADAVCPEASRDDDPADIRRLATAVATAAAGTSAARGGVVRSWLILRVEDPGTANLHWPQSDAGAFSNRCFGSHTGLHTGSPSGSGSRSVLG